MKLSYSILLFLCLPFYLFGADYPDISVKELQSAIKRGNVAVIDVNGARSFNKGHIPTAIDFSSEGKKLASILPKDKSTLVVSYCGGPGCRAYKRGADAAAKLGYKNVKHLSAGISGWKKSGAEVAKK
jgi:rhodanese-related sulfurtransferase